MINSVRLISDEISPHFHCTKHFREFGECPLNLGKQLGECRKKNHFRSVKLIFFWAIMEGAKSDMISLAFRHLLFVCFTSTRSKWVTRASLPSFIWLLNENLMNDKSSTRKEMSKSEREAKEAQKRCGGTKA